MASVPYSWSGHDDEGNVVTGSGSVTLTSDSQPPPGLPYVGSSMQNNGDPSSLETFCGRTLGIRRTYWNLNTSGPTNVNDSVTTATADAAKGRLPWISYKLRTGQTWATASTGGSDADITSLNTRLAAIPGQVWVAIHHEPEGDGDLQVWKAMQRRLLPLFTAPNVRTSIITTGYDTWFDPDRVANGYTMDALWPGSMCDIMGADRYNPPTGFMELKVTYDKIAADCVRLGAQDWAIGETGYTDAQAQQDPDWLTRGFDDMANHPVKPGLGLSYFNSTANSGTNTWPLGSGVKRDKFKAILNRSHA